MTTTRRLIDSITLPEPDVSGSPFESQVLDSSTTPARVLTVEQRHELWELFCSYGLLRREAEFAVGTLRDIKEGQRLRREADQVQERYGDLIWSLTERAGG